MSPRQVCDLTVRILTIKDRRKPASCWSSLVFFRISQDVKIVQRSTWIGTFFVATLREKVRQIIVRPRLFLTVGLKNFLKIQQKVKKQLVWGEQFVFWTN